MFENDEDSIEENINKKKGKKVSKHFEILINGRKIKIANFQIKDYKNSERSGKIIKLISKFKILDSQRKNVKLEIKNEGKFIELVGDFYCSVTDAGIYTVYYWINKIDEK